MKRLNIFLLVMFVATVSAAAQTHADWMKFSSAEGRYSIMLPGEPTVKNSDAKDGDGKPLIQHNATLTDGNGAFLVTYFDYGADSTFSLEVARDGIIKGVSGTLEGDEVVNIGGVAGKAITVSAKTSTGVDFIDRARIADVNRRVYILQCIFPTSEDAQSVVSKCDKFANSFALSK